jgi:hypothetical protein
MWAAEEPTMRLHPRLTEEEAFAWLMEQAKQLGPLQRPEELERTLRPVAQSMAAISAVVLPPEFEPLFT